MRYQHILTRVLGSIDESARQAKLSLQLVRNQWATWLDKRLIHHPHSAVVEAASVAIDWQQTPSMICLQRFGACWMHGVSLATMNWWRSLWLMPQSPLVPLFLGFQINISSIQYTLSTNFGVCTGLVVCGV
jgi:hypothetical protein